MEKRPEFAIEAQELLADLKQNLGLINIRSMRILNRYDVLGLTDEEFLKQADISFIRATSRYAFRRRTCFRQKM